MAPHKRRNKVSLTAPRSLLQLSLLCVLFSIAAIPVVILTASSSFLMRTEDYWRIAPLGFALVSLAILPFFLASQRYGNPTSGRHEANAVLKPWCPLSFVPILCFVMSLFIVPAFQNPRHVELSQEELGWPLLYLLNGVGLLAAKVAIRHVLTFSGRLQGLWVAMLGALPCVMLMIVAVAIMHSWTRHGTAFLLWWSVSGPLCLLAVIVWRFARPRNPSTASSEEANTKHDPP